MASSILEKKGVAILCLMLIASFQVSRGAVHKVGDSAGWTTIGNVDYKQWAIAKTFQLGDIIVFEYNPQFHNVMRVTHAEYKACNVSSPITTHTTGNDSITIDTHGHHLFICGVPSHCQAGQKVDINVLRAPSIAATPSESDSPATAPPPLTAATSPSIAAAPRALNMPLRKMAWMILQLLCMFGLS
ncbi:hypothetical protein ACS0TY_022719 [Phlomoides rotata]